jgi:ribosomal-protein-alanine N-acetyltransferase
MLIELEKCVVRSYRESDADTLPLHANNRKVWLNLRDGFPHPYTRDDALNFIKMALENKPETHFAIVVDGQAVGGIGFSLHTDVERVSAEIGYWLGEMFWNRGITSEALQAVTHYAVQEHNLKRLYAVPYEWNPASFRVLEKAGYILEGRMHRSVIKDGKIIDQLLYAYIVKA